MNLWKYGLIWLTILLVIGTSCRASATVVNDPVDDVWHRSQTGRNLSWTGEVQDKPEIDITSVSAMVNGSNLTLSITLVGAVISSQNITYWVVCNTTDSSYSLYWSNGRGIGYGSLKQEGASSYDNNLTVSGNTITAVLKQLSNASVTDLWGMTAEYTTVGMNQTQSEWWSDWVPNSRAPFSNTTGENSTTTPGNNTGKKTPGFEALPVLVAVALIAALARRRH